MNPLPFVYAGLRQYPLFFALFTLLIALAVALGIAVSASERAVRVGTARAADKFDLIIAAPGSPVDVVLSTLYLRTMSIPLLDTHVFARILEEKRVDIAAPIAFGDHYGTSPIIGTIAPFITYLSNGLAEGRLFTTRNEAVMGASVKQEIGITLTPRHGVDHHASDDEDDDSHAHPISITLVGRMQPTGTPWDHAILVPIEQVWYIHGLPDGHAPHNGDIGPPFDPAFLSPVPAVILHPLSINNAYRLRSLFKTQQSMAFFPAEVLTNLYSIMGDARLLLTIISLCTQTLVALAIFAALTALFTLNKRQISILQTLGAPIAFVGTSYWLLIGLVICTGACMGLIIGAIATKAVLAILQAETGITFVASLQMNEYIVALAFTAMGLVFAWIPAWMMAYGVQKPENAL